MKPSTVFVILMLLATIIIPWICMGMVVESRAEVKRMEKEVEQQRNVIYDLQENVIKLWGTVSKG